MAQKYRGWIFVQNYHQGLSNGVFAIEVNSLKTRPKLVLSDALAVQSQGLRVQGPKVSCLKVVLGSQKMLWDLKFFG